MDSASVRRLIEAFTDSSANRLAPGRDEPAFDPPLVGFARGDDPLWDFLKKDIGEFFWTPEEAFANAFPDDPAEGADLRVISWVLPQTGATKAAQAKRKEFPAPEWSMVRLHGEAINEALRRHMVNALASWDVAACAPALSPEFQREYSDKYQYASRWSERHAAFMAGHGTFGLCDALITPVGKAHRVGSVVARVDLPASPRPWTDHHAHCLHFTKNRCRACAKRCPAGAISEHGHDKEKCRAYIRGTTALHVEHRQLGVRVSSCGLCQAGVPCADGFPGVKKNKSG
ncbi:4Fe-4S ferredoxin [Desulfohalovibrio reitneri]|uniref:4Fe-4S ferredoxin n=1 Tax=Desulfohalovibrio reitneri TaxID=1307759 RepID=UPI000552E924|nr:4Fe-4S ferredoxin [Desulfohalovibrio reitneri]